MQQQNKDISIARIDAALRYYINDIVAARDVLHRVWRAYCATRLHLPPTVALTHAILPAANQALASCYQAKWMSLTVEAWRERKREQV